jgi:hypothetical protein
MAEHDGAPERVHPIQKLMDNMWLLLALGVLVPAISYTAWGWIDLVLAPTALLP